jgi:predicted TPR repeat methyltransferase
MIEPSQSTKERLYAGYVSTGQAATTAPEKELIYQSRLPYLRRLIRQLMPFNSHERVGDLGCGAGSLLRYLKEIGCTDVLGVDLSGEMVGLAHSMGVFEAQQGDLFEFLRRQTDRSFHLLF